MDIIQVVQPFVQNVLQSVREKNSLMVFLLFLVGTPLCLSFDSLQKEPLSQEARYELSSFFRILFTESEFAYTVFGDKPMTFYSYFFKYPKECFIFAKLFELNLEHHYKTYEKYKYLFNTNSILLIDQLCISNKFPTSGYVRDILVINKKAFIETVDQHIDLFKKRLAIPVTGKDLLIAIESGKNVLYEVLKEDELLWGILLGYGVHNAELYARREEICESKATMPSGGFISLKKELEFIDHNLTPFSRDQNIDLIPLPRFACDEQHNETITLKNKYLATQREVCDIYLSADFLNLILNKLDIHSKTNESAIIP